MYCAPAAYQPAQTEACRLIKICVYLYRLELDFWDERIEQAMAKKILVVDDKRELRSLLKQYLTQEGFDVLLAEDGQKALFVARQEKPDLILLDLMMPEMGGYEFMRVYSREADTPIIILTAKLEENDKVLGLELGADDYITKSFTFREVEARIQAILCRIEWSQRKAAHRTIAIGRVKIDPESHEVFVDGESRHLTPIEFQLLYHLMSHAGQTISKAALFEEVWGYDFVGGTNLVEVGIRRLREKIEENPSEPTHILTVRGMGYRFREP